MSFIEGLHGVVAIVLLCTVLLAEEAGVPLPMPGELAPIVAGLLIGTGGLDPWFFVPLAIASCVAGSLAGYSWARIVGEHGLAAAAERFHQTKRLNRVTARLKVAGARDIGLCRLIPGLRSTRRWSPGRSASTAGASSWASPRAPCCGWACTSSWAWWLACRRRASSVSCRA